MLIETSQTENQREKKKTRKSRLWKNYDTAIKGKYMYNGNTRRKTLNGTEENQKQR